MLLESTEPRMFDAPSTETPPSFGGASGSDEIPRLLERARRTFEVRTAALVLFGQEGVKVGCWAGPPFALAPNALAFYRTAADADRGFVVPDTRLDSRYGPDVPAIGGARIRFQAGAPLPATSGGEPGLLCLFDERPRRLAPAQKRRLDELSEDMAAALARRRDADEIARLRREFEAQAAMIREQATTLVHRQAIFARAAAAARMGVWECALPDERLTWTDGVYDIFELPRGSALDRATTLRCYSEASRKELERVRSRAIAERGGFNLDAEIVTAKGSRRWIRLTATVESHNGVAVRIFGVKQDITEEKALADRTRYMAEFDAMTGLANRSVFQTTLSELADRRAGPNRLGALLLIDLDGFKQINDTFGHALGDACLKETAVRLRDVCRAAELVARIGGDEFAVLLGRDVGEAATARLAAGIVEALCRPVACDGGVFPLGASVGVASADGCAPSELFARADAALYAAKAAGRNTFRTYHPAVTPPMTPPRAEERGGIRSLVG